VERTRQVDGEHGVPTLGREVLDRGHVLDAGVVDQHVGAAERLRHVLHHGLDFGRLAHVGAVVADLHAERGDLRLRPFNVAEAIEHDVRALAGQRPGDAEADAAGGTCDEGGLAFQHGFLSCPG
jgi:hypothetical protein